MSLFPYVLTLIAAFFLLPLYAAYSSEDKVLSILLLSLFFVNPAACFITAFLFSIRNGFHWSFLVMVAVLFILASLIFFGISACVYLPIYLVAALTGSFIGSFLKKWVDEMWL